jgi:ABC-type transport system involved in cytochrome bd biosynthesis fused ATPase/permease subunit
LTKALSRLLFGASTDAQVASFWLSQLQLRGLEARRAAQLSNGQRQRVVLAHALCRSLELLLLEEPWKRNGTERWIDLPTDAINVWVLIRAQRIRAILISARDQWVHHLGSVRAAFRLEVDGKEAPSSPRLATVGYYCVASSIPA